MGEDGEEINLPKSAAALLRDDADDFSSAPPPMYRASPSVSTSSTSLGDEHWTVRRHEISATPRCAQKWCPSELSVIILLIGPRQRDFPVCFSSRFASGLTSVSRSAVSWTADATPLAHLTSTADFVCRDHHTHPQRGRDTTGREFQNDVPTPTADGTRQPK